MVVHNRRGLLATDGCVGTGRMQVVMDRGVVGAKRYHYEVDDVRDGRLHRTLQRDGWACDIGTMEELQLLVNQQGALILEPDYETDAHLRGEVPSCESMVQWVASFSARRRGMVVAAFLLLPVLVEVIDRLNLIPGF